jgi:integrase
MPAGSSSYSNGLPFEAFFATWPDNKDADGQLPSESLFAAARTDGKRERIPDPAQAISFLGALRDEPERGWRDRPFVSTAVYAGLRRGEILALRWDDIDFEHGMIRVDESYDPKSKTFGPPKTKAAYRNVPMIGPLKRVLASMSLEREPGHDSMLVFGDGTTPVEMRLLAERMATDVKRADLEFEPFSLHECRHGYASLSIAAGVNAKALQTYMGHASITETYDRYGHLSPVPPTRSANSRSATWSQWCRRWCRKRKKCL